MTSGLLDRPLRLFMPVSTPAAAQIAESAGVYSVIAKPDADLAPICSAVDVPVTACLQPLHAYTPAEVEEVLAAGASMLLLRGAKTAYDVKMFVDIVRGRAQTFIWVDKPSLATEMDALRRLRWDAAHVDLSALSPTGSADGFVADATEKQCAHLRGRAFGLGCPRPFGASTPGVFAVSNADRIRAACRLGASVIVMNPRDANDARAVNAHVASARAGWVAACFRSSATVEQDHNLLQYRLGTADLAPTSGDGRAASVSGDGLAEVPDLDVSGSE